MTMARPLVDTSADANKGKEADDQNSEDTYHRYQTNGHAFTCVY